MNVFSWINSSFWGGKKKIEKFSKPFLSSTLPVWNLAQSKVVNTNNPTALLCAAQPWYFKQTCNEMYLTVNREQIHEKPVSSASYVYGTWEILPDWTVPEPRGCLMSPLRSSWQVEDPACPVTAKQFNKADLQDSSWALTVALVFSSQVSSILSIDK